MKQWTGAYVIHECKQCGCVFIAEDYTKATSIPPKWRYCEKCAKEKGIDYAKQTPARNRTAEEQKKIEERTLRMKNARENKK